jgi:purine-cytosine permease-like protein
MQEQPTAPPDSERRTEDRRSTMSLGGRRQAPRRAADRAKLLRDMAALVFALCGGLAVVYLFFAAFGAIDFGEALTASLIALGLGLVWMIGFGYRMRNHAERVQRGDRERRGF